jgi:hypothetical protein
MLGLAGSTQSANWLQIGPHASLTDPCEFDILRSASGAPEVGTGLMKRRDFLTLIGGAAVMWPLTAHAQQPIGAWRAANECFLAAFTLTGNGRAQVRYVSGERDDNAAWTSDGGTLTITSQAFPLDRFSGHLTNDRIEADYVWHDLAKDELNRQTCIFERFTPLGR